AADADAAVSIAAHFQAAQRADRKVLRGHGHVAALVGGVDLAAVGDLAIVVVDVYREVVIAVVAVAAEGRDGQGEDCRGDENSSHVSSVLERLDAGRRREVRTESETLSGQPARTPALRGWKKARCRHSYVRRDTQWYDSQIIKS